jgi:hypothetical protein
MDLLKRVARPAATEQMRRLRLPCSGEPNLTYQRHVALYDSLGGEFVVVLDQANAHLLGPQADQRIA